MNQTDSSQSWDHGSNDEFTRYYEAESRTLETRVRFSMIRDTVLRTAQPLLGERPYDVADIGCGAGTQCRLWAELGHRVCGLDVNGPLLEVARRRASDDGLKIDFRLGSATSLPLADGCVDICLAVELLEHVVDWKSCINEFTRITRPGGILFMSTTNWLCPVQSEFDLPLYSWYPGSVKRHCERLSVTSKPWLANYAKYPAVNWFSYYMLRRQLASRGFATTKDRFDLIDVANKGQFARGIVTVMRSIPPLRWLGHVATSGTTILAVKEASH